jgi:hypothetical protein
MLGLCCMGLRGQLWLVCRLLVVNLYAEAKFSTDALWLSLRSVITSERKLLQLACRSSPTSG